MKIIITIVGASIFENYKKEEVEKQIDNYVPITDTYEHLKRAEPAQDIHSKTFKKSAKNIKKTVKSNWFRNCTKIEGEWRKQEGVFNRFASAEIESILSISKAIGEFSEVYLLATDTALSMIACELIKEWFEDYKDEKIKIHFNLKQDILQDLKIDNATDFKRGLVSLNDRYYEITRAKLLTQQYDDVILNITAGYKVIVPYLTLLGQINRSQIKYTFENTGVLISIPQLPIQIEETLFEKYWDELHKLDQEGAFHRSEYYSLAHDLNGFFDFDRDGSFTFNYLGLAIWEKYKQQYFTFYSPDDVWKEIKKQKDIMRILTTKLSIKSVREGSKNELKGDKRCYDDGDNNNRIYNFSREEKFYIYKTFENEESAKKYINHLIDEDELITKSKPRKISITKTI